MNSNYILDDEFMLIKADLKEFAIHYTTYRENIFFRQSWERRLSIFDDDTSSYWITYKNKRIGGVSIEPNSLSSFFTEPPFIDTHPLLVRLKKLLLECSDLSQPIHAYGILPYQIEHFLRLGFMPIESRRIMIRPTEFFESQEWGEELEIVTPTMEYIEKIAELCFKSYSGIDSIGLSADNTIKQHKQNLEFYFSNNKAEVLRKASCIVFDKSNSQAVAVCLVSLWEDLPLIADIAVIPQYRGKHIATKLLKKASTVLNKEYDIFRLFVTVGNPAESLYYNFGFYPGLVQTTFHLPYRHVED